MSASAEHSPLQLDGGKLWSLQALRCLAATLVVIAHGVDSSSAIDTNTPWLGRGNLENLGAIGLDIFFVISGFIITTTLARNPTIPARRFMLQRMIRVLPPYYLLSLPWLVMGLLAQGFYPSKLLASVFLWPAMPGGMLAPYLGIGWTLCFEMLFYTAVFLTRALRWPIASIVPLFAMLIVAQELLGWTVLTFIGNPIIIEFLFGVLLGLQRERLARLSSRVRRVLAALVLLWLGVLIARGFGGISEAQFVLDASLSTQRVLVFGIPALLITLLFIGHEARARTRVQRFLSFLGDASYATYLVHTLIILIAVQIVHRGQFRVEGNLWLLLIVTLTLAAGAAMHVLVERPMTRALRRRFKA